MSEIRDPAQTETPSAPGDEGLDQASPGNAQPSGASAQPSRDEDGPAPGNERPSSARTGSDEEDGPQPGNERKPAAQSAAADAPVDDDADAQGPDVTLEEESPEDSIGNRLDRPPTHTGTASGAQVQPGQGGKKNRRKKGKGGGGGAHPEARAQGEGGGNARASQDPNAHRAFHVGDKVRAKVVSIGEAGAMVDLWGKEHGVLDLREIAVEGEPAPQVGDGVDVVVMQDGSRGGNLVVTRDPARADRAREALANAFNNNEAIEGLITGTNRGGLEVDLSGVRAFCPSSQMDVRYPPTVNPKSLVLTRQLFKVTSLVEDGREAIVSRRSILEKDARARAEEARANIQVGSIVKGRVVAIKDYGVFVDLGGIEGLIHITELTHNRSARPSDVVKVGEEVEAKVLRISGGQREQPPANQHEEQGATPAESEAPPASAAAEGEASESDAGAETHGAEAAASGEHEPAEGAEATAGETAAASEGTEASAPAGGKASGKGARQGEGKKGKKPQRRGRGVEGLPRVMLSRRAIEPDPWSTVDKQFRVGSLHTGTVARMQPFGAFVELAPAVDGLLHVSELGEGRRLEHPNEVLKDGQTVHVRVERVEKDKKRISLSLVPEGVTEEQLRNAIVPRPGMITQAKIVEHDAAGVWAQVERTVGKIGRGLIPPQESNQPRGTDLRKAIPVGTDVRVKVVEIDRGRMKLSIRAALQDEERQAYRAYQREATSTRVGVSLADKLRAKLGGMAGGGSSNS